MSNKDPFTACVFNSTTIVVTDVTEVTIAAGALMQLTLYGMINSLYAAPTDTFTFDVLTSDGSEIMH